MRRNFGNKTLVLIQNRIKRSFLTNQLTVSHLSGLFLLQLFNDLFIMVLRFAAKVSCNVFFNVQLTRLQCRESIFTGSLLSCDLLFIILPKRDLRFAAIYYLMFTSCYLFVERFFIYTSVYL